MMNHYNDILQTSVSYAFVAVDFSNKYQHIYDEVIYPAVLDAGILPIRSDEVSSTAINIHAQIEHLIRNSRFFVADITYIRESSLANICLETGLAIAFSRPMVIMTQDEEIPADFRHLRILKYELSEHGRYEVRKELTSIIQKSANPAEAFLRKILIHTEIDNYIVYGQASQLHIKEVFPPVNESYLHRLETMSSEASGISQMTVAFQKIAQSMGKERLTIIPVNANTAPHNIFTYGNIYVFGGPGANPIFNAATHMANSIYENALSMAFEKVNQKNRFYISKGNKKYPEDQYKLYEEKKDIGFVMRFSNPQRSGSAITVAAGIRSYGTEGAIKLLVTPSLISKLDVYPNLDDNTGFWALIETSCGHENKQLEHIRVMESEILIKRIPPIGTCLAL